MPSSAFKLWIYCLLTASPRLDRARELEVGELWLNYEHVRQVLGEARRQMSKSTVSKALKYLEQGGYLKKESRSFYGVKVRVVNWQENQLATNSAAGPENIPVEVPPGTSVSPETTPVDSAPGSVVGTETLPLHSAPGSVVGTEILPLHSASGTPPGAANIPAPVPLRGHEANSGAACEVPKNIENKEYKNEELKNNAVDVDLAAQFAREFARALTPLEVRQLTKWRNEFPAEVLLDALARATLHGKRTLAYVGGILANKRKNSPRAAESPPQMPGGYRGQGGPGVKSAAERKREFIRSLYL